MPWAGRGLRRPPLPLGGPQRTADHEHRDLHRAGPDPRVAPGWPAPVGVSPVGPGPAGAGLSGDLAGRNRPPRSRARPPGESSDAQGPLGALRLGGIRRAVLVERRTPATRPGRAHAGPRRGRRGRPAAQPVALPPRIRGAPLPTVRVRRHRPRTASDLDDSGRHPNGTAPHLLYYRRDRRDPDGPLPRLRPPLALHAAPRLPARVAACPSGLERAVHDYHPLV